MLEEERMDVLVYIQDGDNIIAIYNSLYDPTSDFPIQESVIGHNQRQSFTTSFTIPEDAPKGKYSISFYYRTTKTTQIYADAIEVK